MKQRFCKDNGLSIQLFKEPYFTSRLELLGQLDKYNRFKKLIELEFDGNEEKYFEYYGKLKDNIIDFIKESEAYKMMQSDKMDKYSCTYDIKQSDVYKVPNIGEEFISIDMVKANFSSLVYYGQINGYKFFDSYDYRKFIGQFTAKEHFIDSKYIRQVVFGNCCAKKQIAFEKYLMSMVLKSILEIVKIDIKEVHSLCSDEIILYAKNISTEQYTMIKNLTLMFKFPLRVERYTLGVVTSETDKSNINNSNTYAYVKKLGYRDLELKCVEPINLPFVLKTINDIKISDEDLYFSHNGKLAKLIDKPELRLIY